MLRIFMMALSNKSILVPKYKLDNVGQIITISQLMDKEKMVYIFDKDDTLVSLHQFKIKDGQTSQLMSALKNQGKRVYIVSNSVREQGNYMTYLDDQNKQHRIDILHTKQKKPYNGQQIKHLIQQNQQSTQVKLNSKNTVAIGDRLLTDIVLGNLQGWTTVLVSPVQPTTVKKHGFGVFLMRKFEKAILNIL